MSTKTVVDDGGQIVVGNDECRPREKIENGRVINMPTEDGGMVAEYKCDPFYRLKGMIFYFFIILFYYFICYYLFYL